MTSVTTTQNFSQIACQLTEAAQSPQLNAKVVHESLEKAASIFEVSTSFITASGERINDLTFDASVLYEEIEIFEELNEYASEIEQNLIYIQDPILKKEIEESLVLQRAKICQVEASVVKDFKKFVPRIIQVAQLITSKSN